MKVLTALALLSFLVGAVVLVDALIERVQRRQHSRAIERRARMTGASLGYSALWDGEPPTRHGGFYVGAPARDFVDSVSEIFAHASSVPPPDTIVVSPEVAERMRLLEEARAAGDVETIERLKLEAWARLGL